MPEQYTILGGKVHVYKRPNSSLWQCSSYFTGKNRRTSTKEDSLAKAEEIAEDWYLQVRRKLRSGEIKTVPARIRHHHAGPAQQRPRQRPALAVDSAPGAGLSA